MIRLIKGERVMANQTLRIDGHTAIIKGRYYQIKGAKTSCCKQKVDVGYMHTHAIVQTCVECSFKSPASRRVWIPSSYFRRPGEAKSKVDRAMENMEKLFKKLG